MEQYFSDYAFRPEEGEVVVWREDIGRPLPHHVNTVHTGKPHAFMM